MAFIQVLRLAAANRFTSASVHPVMLIACAAAKGGTSLIGAAFLSKWNQRPLLELFDYIRTTMPPTKAGKLSTKNYARVLAYLLQENGFPSGSKALPVSTAKLAKIDFVKPTTKLNASTKAADTTLNVQAEWPYYGGNAASQRYSPLDIINRDNVKNLSVAWRWKADNFGPRPEFNFRATPLMMNGVLYVSAGIRRVVAAIDAVSGETLWTYRIDEGERVKNAPRVNSGRGVAYWADDDERRILFVTPGYQLIALNADTGLPIKTFGNKGKVELKQGLGRELDPVTAPLGSSSPPMIVGDIAVVGTALPSGFAPPSAAGPPGHVRGFDVRSGEQKWIFHTIPHPGETGYESWEDKDAWRTAGNVATWTSMSADPELGYVYLPLEAATGDHYGGHRHGDNLFSQSLVCLDAKTGKYVWHYQTVHHGIWDYDLPAAPILLDINVEGKKIPAVAQLTKQAFTFVFDRRNGEPVWPIEEKPVPQSTVPGEKTSATQPFPSKPAPFSRQGVSEDDLIDFTPELRAEAIKIMADYTIGPLYTPPSLVTETNKGTLLLPFQGGGANWSGGAADPETGVLYVGSSSIVGAMRMSSDPSISSMKYIAVGDPMFSNGPQKLPMIKPPWGSITAIDLNSGDHLWRMANGEPHEYIRNHPALKGVKLGRTGRPDRAGLLVTKTLLFAGEGGGQYATINGGGPMFRAHDKATGEIIFEYELPANQTGLPMSYAIDDRQYIVLAIGAPDHPAELIALTLSE
ncbi:MAG: PQQ-binding-like beta-propeller repeat protein [Gammaproteobacteria bacterium]|nr:PQQ-binding-like beta-propeller repeat protein [Gammaproteobacteria bacterium]